MTGLFAALEARFNANPTLQLKGRKLYDGFQEASLNVTKPYSEVNYELSDDLSSFSSDIEEYELRFRYHAKDLRTGAATAWVDAMTEAFRDANILSGAFTTAGCRRTKWSVPNLTDGLYDASITFKLIVKRTLNSPVVRGT